MAKRTAGATEIHGFISLGKDKADSSKRGTTSTNNVSKSTVSNKDDVKKKSSSITTRVTKGDTDNASVGTPGKVRQLFAGQNEQEKKKTLSKRKPAENKPVVSTKSEIVEKKLGNVQRPAADQKVVTTTTLRKEQEIRRTKMAGGDSTMVKRAGVASQNNVKTINRSEREKATTNKTGVYSNNKQMSQQSKVKAVPKTTTLNTKPAVASVKQKNTDNRPGTIFKSKPGEVKATKNKGDTAKKVISTNQTSSTTKIPSKVKTSPSMGKTTKVSKNEDVPTIVAPPALSRQGTWVKENSDISEAAKDLSISSNVENYGSDFEEDTPTDRSKSVLKSALKKKPNTNSPSKISNNVDDQRLEEDNVNGSKSSSLSPSKLKPPEAGDATSQTQKTLKTNTNTTSDQEPMVTSRLKSATMPTTKGKYKQTKDHNHNITKQRRLYTERWLISTPTNQRKSIKKEKLAVNTWSPQTGPPRTSNWLKREYNLFAKYSPQTNPWKILKNKNNDETVV